MPLLASYCCEISEAKNMSAVYHVVAMNRACVKVIMTGEGIISGKMAFERSKKKTNKIRTFFIKFTTKYKGCVENVNEVGQE